MLPDDLTTADPEQLYRWKDDLTEYGRAEGRGHSEQAAYVRQYVRDERERIDKELDRRELDHTASDDTRVYGPGQAPWQRAAAA